MGDIEIVQSGTSEKVELVIFIVSYFLTSYGVALVKVPQVAGMLVSVLPCYFLMAFLGAHYLKNYTRRIAQHSDAATSIASLSLSHLMLVHAFNAHSCQVDREWLSIARALVRRPRLLLLDESTSTLGVKSEKKIQDAVSTLAGKITVVAIADRLNTIHEAYCVYPIEEGRCVEQGTHDELVQVSETYRTSVIRQSLEA